MKMSCRMIGKSETIGDNSEGYADEDTRFGATGVFSNVQVVRRIVFNILVYEAMVLGS